MAQQFDVVRLGGGVAGEELALGLEGSGLTLAVVERELVSRSGRQSRGPPASRDSVALPGPNQN
jgi:2-polyprenyl-6-methoxyphenol hydroxylase-like FAD-dependent oxidoreductase